jgi:phosphatidylserine decarboxylase
MKIDPAGYPFIVISLVPAVACAGFGLYPWAAPFLALALAMALFFRDPDRQVPLSDDVVVSPADGKVMVVGNPQPGAAPPGNWTQLSIFLSPLDVHVNRMPMSGRVTRVDYHPGAFRAAFKPEATTENERNEIWLDTKAGPVVCRQITGVLVRRVVCRAAVGDIVRAGDRFGVMKFGSRIDLFLPRHARVLVQVGGRVTAGESRLAEF